MEARDGVNFLVEYNPDTDKSELIQLLAGGNFMGGSASQKGEWTKGLKGIMASGI